MSEQQNCELDSEIPSQSRLRTLGSPPDKTHKNRRETLAQQSVLQGCIKVTYSAGSVKVVNRGIYWHGLIVDLNSWNVTTPWLDTFSHTLSLSQQM